MASLTYLYKKRAQFSFFSYAFIKAWGKRIILLPDLYRRNRRKIKLINAGAKISETSEIGELKADGKKANLEIGENSFIGKAEFALHDKIRIGDCVCINDGVFLLTASHDVSDSEWKHKKAPIVVEDYAWICTNAIILPGVEIGKGAVVGAGAVVSKNVDAFDIVAGNPAKSVGKKRTEELNYNPCEFLAANMAWLKG